MPPVTTARAFRSRSGLKEWGGTTPRTRKTTSLTVCGGVLSGNSRLAGIHADDPCFRAAVPAHHDPAFQVSCRAVNHQFGGIVGYLSGFGADALKVAGRNQ